MRLGYEKSITDSTNCVTLYRSHVYFNLAPYAGKGLVLKAKLLYSKFMGDNCCIARPFTLDQKWNGGGKELWSVDISPVNPSNLVSTVQKWLAYPNDNYGILFAGPPESWAWGNGKCIGFWENVKLEIEILEKK
jgi:hypothetical protein